jgi:hypothetical protein
MKTPVVQPWWVVGGGWVPLMVFQITTGILRIFMITCCPASSIGIACFVTAGVLLETLYICTPRTVDLAE